VAKEFAETGFSSLKSLGFFWIVMMGSLAVHALITLPLLLKFVAKVNPFFHFKAMGSAMITAFCTSSSSATLPVTIDCLQKKAGVSSKIASLVAPLGASINLSASAMYVFIISTFLASAYGMPLSFNTQFTIFLLSLLTTLGIACVPSGCLITIILVLKAIGLPAEAVGLVVAVDRFVDMFRTMTNVFGTSSCAVIVAKLEKEKNLFSNYNAP
jgi:Na+/H+-dicarboxylate symporter